MNMFVVLSKIDVVGLSICLSFGYRYSIWQIDCCQILCKMKQWIKIYFQIQVTDFIKPHVCKIITGKYHVTGKDNQGSYHMAIANQLIVTKTVSITFVNLYRLFLFVN